MHTAPGLASGQFFMAAHDCRLPRTLSRLLSRLRQRPACVALKPAACVRLILACLLLSDGLDINLTDT
ncbi:hypothetical protein GCM10010970_10460 [Silvimonas iriomotensis]|uniref:Uncharacterized protein n=1 Tax=Silvimonas iriomotensis TaxID=449662 RepID=A0ABQ2P6H5_9NEIS|nr:hypothetical protein GCM10010970_10460 [Silvimonas iriomotensis]